MTNWHPHLEGRPGPRYLAIAETIAEDVAGGRLAVGQRLPTHRDLAHALGVTVGTVSRAYGEATRRGLLTGEVGRGTFVREAAGKSSEFLLGASPEEVDLRLNLPPVAETPRLLSDTLRQMADGDDLGGLLRYNPGAGLAAHRRVLAEWCARRVAGAEAARITICSGAQHAMSVVFLALTRPGDVVLTEDLTYPGMKSLAEHLNLRLWGVSLDRHGVIPDALDRACRSTGASIFYGTPTLQNPTTSVAPEGRRREIAAIARRHDLSIVEDDINGILLEGAPPPLATMAPERTFFIDGVSKYLAPGLRVGYVLAPADRLGRLHAALRATTWMAAPLMVEVACRWLGDGTGERMAAWHRAEAGARRDLARRHLGDAIRRSHPGGYHAWMDLPDPWRAETFAAEARRRGVLVLPTETFAVGRGGSAEGVRLGLGAVPDRERLGAALECLNQILTGPPGEPAASFI